MNGSNSFVKEGRSAYGTHLIKRAMNRLRTGRIYKIPVVRGDGEGTRRTFWEPMELVKLYPHFALFETVGGKARLRTCIKYMELANIVVPDEYKENLIARLTPDEPNAKAGHRKDLRGM